MLKKVLCRVVVKHAQLIRSPRYNFAVSKQQQNQNQVNSSSKSQPDKSSYQEDDDQQPQFQHEDRTTRGWLIYRFIFWGSFSLLGYHLYLVSNHQGQTPVHKQSFTVPGFLGSANFIYSYYTQMTQFLTKPPASKLLPDVIHPLMHPKTLVLNVSGTLLDHDFIIGKGVHIKKRPGLQQFLKKMSQMYQIVIFSDDDSIFLQSIVPTLDPRQQMISGSFGRQCMVFSKGQYIKDLKYLNRDLRNVVVIDKNFKTVTKHKENVITVSEYKGDQSDKQLFALALLLENLAKPQVRDVRKTLTKIGENPLEKYSELLKEKQQKMKNNKGSKLFDMFSKKN